MGKAKQISIELEVKSNHPNIPTTALLKEIQEALPQMEADLSQGRIVQKSSLRREGTLPLDAHTATVALESFVGTTGGILGAELVKKFADDAYAWLKKKWAWASFSSKSISTKDTSKDSKARAQKKQKKVRKTATRKKSKSER
jgi:hypothetical protein